MMSKSQFDVYLTKTELTASSSSYAKSLLDRWSKLGAQPKLSVTSHTLLKEVSESKYTNLILTYITTSWSLHGRSPDH